MRVLVSVDMEGTGGVVHGDDIRPGHSEYERNRSLLTEETNAAVRGVYARVLVAEAAEVAPGIHCVVVKHALGARAAALLHPAEVRDRIEHEVPLALAGRAEVRALRFDGPVDLEVDVFRPFMTEHALLIPGIERTSGCTLRYAAPDFPTAYRVTELIAVLAGME